MTDELVDRWRESQLALMPSDARDEALRTLIREAGIPDRQPAWNALAVDARGDVRVRHCRFDRREPST